jgi:hypothetical protein
MFLALKIMLYVNPVDVSDVFNDLIHIFQTLIIQLAKVIWTWDD